MLTFFHPLVKAFHKKWKMPFNFQISTSLHNVLGILATVMIVFHVGFSFWGGGLAHWGFYILVLSFGILTFEVDHTAMIFRDMASLGRLPIEVYRQPLRSFLTFLIPLGVMITLPSRVLMGIISPLSVVGSCALGIVFLYFSTKIWSFALTKYTSASS